MGARTHLDLDTQPRRGRQDRRDWPRRSRAPAASSVGGSSRFTLQPPGGIVRESACPRARDQCRGWRGETPVSLASIGATTPGRGILVGRINAHHFSRLSPASSRFGTP
jgi:hypothetical protein